MSLTRTLILLVAAIVMLIASAAATWSYIESNHELEELFDAELAQSTRVVQGLVQHLAATQSSEQLAGMLKQTLQLPQGALDEGDYDEILPDGTGHKYEKKLAFEVWTAAGEPILDTLAANDDQALNPGYAWSEATGFKWRTFTLQDTQTGYWIRTAQREDIRQELSQELALSNILPLLAALPLLVIAVAFAIQFGFRPLRKLENPIRHMDPESIHPLETRHAPKEVSGLVGAVNGLLKRLDDALERERRFSADAAHELRTPLTALRLNLEKIDEKNPGEFSDLTASVDRMVHLVEQMLLLSRLESGTGFSPEDRNLSDIVAQSIADVAPLALQKHIEPSLDDRVGQAMIRCQAPLVNTLMRSLLANAIQYSPPGTSVNTRLEPINNGYQVLICDQGPGIPTKEREKAVSRFTRLDQRQGSGAGLGLAIAHRIAEMHGGRLTLLNRPDDQTGLCVSIWFPTRSRSAPRREPLGRPWQ
ncbi:ATP-binding protein [Marinobacter sp. HN1S83]|uniref:ATP-binding protein n=1 Tax=Marinobacter sp. HN1S83 TaxID=3382301 RepID=UPI00387AD23F